MNFPKKTIKDIDLEGKRVLVRIDWDVPGDDEGEVTDDFRIRMSLPTVEYLLSKNCSLVLMSKRGRPKSQETKLSLSKVADKASQLIGRKVQFVNSCRGDAVDNAIKNLEPQDILLLENLRFDSGEKARDAEFAKLLASYGEVFVNDAFAMAHREEASTTGVPQHLPAVAGLLMETEVSQISSILNDPDKPVLAITGGAKLETKLPLLENFMRLADNIVIAGVMANTMLVAQGYSVGKSIYDSDELTTAKRMLKLTEDNDAKLILPLEDVAVGDSVDTLERREIKTSDVGDEDLILDFGQSSLETVLSLVADAKTIIWNGPLGYYENKLFATGSEQLAQAIADSQAVSLVGGGDTGEVVNSLGLTDRFTHVSTGGGASLELLSGRKLPAVEILLDK